MGVYNMSKKPPQKTFYKVLIQKTYRNVEGYVYMHPKNADKEKVGLDKSFTMVYHFKKIPNLHNPMFIVETVTGDEFRGRIKIVKHFEEHHALAYAVDQDLNGKEFGEK